MQVSHSRCSSVLTVLILLAVSASVLPASQQLTLSPKDSTPSLSLKSEGEQLLISAVTPDGLVVDVTRQVVFSSESELVIVDSTGWVTPLKDGTDKLRVSLGTNSFQIPCVVSGAESVRPISFRNDVVPQLTRAGCNGGACHGTPKGKNNFRLSLLGFEPEEDFEFLTRESRGRRFFPAAPDRSLVLLKASGGVPHGGGLRIRRESGSYRTLRRWIQEGMQWGPEDEPVVESIDVQPGSRVVERGESQQLRVIARMSDGTVRDITRIAEYKANQPDMAVVDDAGLATMMNVTGTSSVMVRFQEHVGSFLSTIPLGAPVPELPDPAGFIDHHVNAKLRTLGLPPSEVCDDVTFLRRVSLDISGRLPTLEETTSFLTSESDKPRAELIDHYLRSNGYADLFANKWSSLLRNKAGGNLEQVARETYGFHNWLQKSIRDNKPFDRLTTELITARGKPGTNPAVSWYRAVKDINERMADVAQVFLGVRIECAQCHHHPYEKWSQDDYHGFSAFFTTLDRKEVNKLPEDDILYHKRVLAVATNPNTGEQLRPTPLDAEPLSIPASRDPRIDLAEWVTSKQNPWFAKVLVNRYWKHFFGRGLVEPEDDIRITNPATHPELLDELAESFVDSGFDLKQLCREICNSRAYQRSSFPNEFNAEDEQNYARYYPRRLTAEVMLDAINDVAGARNSFNRQPDGVRAVALPDDSVNNESFFLRVFGRPQMDTACECERSASADLAQSLTLLNSQTMHKILGANGGRAQLFSKDSEADEAAQVRELYIRAFSRPPTDNELAVATRHLARKREQSRQDPGNLPEATAVRQGWEDIIWVVVNTKEFLFNH